MRIYRLIHALLLFEMFRRASRSQIKEDTYLQNLVFTSEVPSEVIRE
jgi:hypothetical protein